MKHRPTELSRQHPVAYAASLAIGLGVGALLGRARHRRISFRNKTVIITGGSRGLGLALAREFAREGARLALLARNPEELHRAEAELQSRGADVIAIPCDLREQTQVNAAIAIVAERFGRIDVLINNAGVIQVGPMENMTVADFEDALAIHLFGPLFTTLGVLPHMRAARRGGIVNISSIGGKIAVPHLLPYSVSKFALVGLSDGLRAELRAHNIFVTTVCPGLIRTGSTGNASFKGHHRQEHAWFTLGASMPLLSMDVRRAARRIVKATRSGSARLILGTHVKAAVLFSELFPGTSADLLALANRWLPDAEHQAGPQSHTGWDSQSKWAPSKLTQLNQKAAAENNEISTQE